MFIRYRNRWPYVWREQRIRLQICVLTRTMSEVGFITSLSIFGVVNASCCSIAHFYCTLKTLLSVEQRKVTIRYASCVEVGHGTSISIIRTFSNEVHFKKIPKGTICRQFEEAKAKYLKLQPLGSARWTCRPIISVEISLSMSLCSITRDSLNVTQRFQFLQKPLSSKCLHRKQREGLARRKRSRPWHT
jgi:hypothetical protein